ncbi:MAG: hypothetical protein CME71_11600 [Halobacteriovorax sp.]|nr:hypothetical protein [Halobacteriovorax sp.]
MKTLIFLMILICSSCSRIEYAANDGIPITWGARASHDTFARVGGVVPLYLWGAVESPIPVSLSAAFAKEGALSVSKLVVGEETSFDVWLPRLLSFGMYWPVKWQAEGFIQKAKFEREQ